MTEIVRLVEDWSRNENRFGFRIVFEYSDYWTDVTVYEISARETDDQTPLFTNKDAVTTPDFVDNIEDAMVYLEGHIKWDGCSELDQGKPHWCGPEYYKDHMALLKHLYIRAQDLMESGNYEPWLDAKNGNLL